MDIPWRHTRKKDYAAAGIDKEFVQDNESSSTKGVLRGLHFQKKHTQGKLVRVVHGEVFDVAVDVRPGSETYGQWVGVMLSSEKKNMFHIPEGFDHGFLVLSDTAKFVYKCTNVYDPASEGEILWNDPDIAVDWPKLDVGYKTSEKDEKHEAFKDQMFDVQFHGRGFAWLDAGAMQSLLQAAEFVEMIQSRQGITIFATEEIAFINGFIRKEKLLENAKAYMASRPAALISKLWLKGGSGMSFKIYGMSLPIFLCTDNNYALPAYVTMYSLLVNYTGMEKLQLYLLTSSDFESRYIRLFKTLKGNYELQIINMQNSFDDAVINTSWITTATMYRLLIPKIARSLNIDKCIYLDSDIVVEGNIAELFDVEFNGFCIGAVKERLISCDRDSELRGLLGVSNLRDYINAGVLLFNLIEIEKMGLSEKLEEAGHRTEYPHNDQDAINAVFHNRIHLLPIRFNAINTYLYDREKDTENAYGSEAIQQARKDPIIIHYIGEGKPWASRGTILAERWWKYVRMQEKKIQTEYFKPFAKASKLALKKRLKEMIKATTMKMDIYKPVRKFYRTIKRIVGYPAAEPWDF